MWHLETGAEAQTFRQIPPTHFLLAADFRPRSLIAQSFEKNLTRFGEADLILPAVEYAAGPETPIRAPVSYTSVKVVIQP